VNRKMKQGESRRTNQGESRRTNHDGHGRRNNARQETMQHRGATSTSLVGRYRWGCRLADSGKNRRMIVSTQ
jgi:hypothetical protein